MARRRQFGARPRLSERGERRTGSASGSITTAAPSRLDLDSRPSQPTNLHCSSSCLSDDRTVSSHRMPRRSIAAVAETRAAVTQAAVDRASVDGLEGLTIGGLAGEVAMRKSSVFSLFGSKEELQMATLDAAVEQFTEEVWAPVAERAGRAPPPAGAVRQLARLPRARGDARRLLFDHCHGRVRRQARPAPRRGRRGHEALVRGPRARSLSRDRRRATCPPTPSRPMWPSSSTPSPPRRATASSSRATPRCSTARGDRCGARSAFPSGAPIGGRLPACARGCRSTSSIRPCASGRPPRPTGRCGRS